MGVMARGRIIRVILLLTAIVGCSQARAAAEGSPPTRPASEVEVREEVILQDSYVANLLAMVSQRGKIGSEGALQGGKGDRRAQGGGWWAIALGLARQDDRGAEKGIRDFERWSGQIAEDGSLGGSQKDTRLLIDYAKAYFLVRDSRLRDRYLGRLTAIAPKAEKAALYFLNSLESGQAARQREQISRYTNQLLGLAVLFRGIGKISSNSTLMRKGEEYYQQAVRDQWADGVFPENNGYDSGYQAVSLQFLAHYYLYLAEDRQEVKSRLEKGWSWQLSRIRENGEINVEGNTRTQQPSQTAGQLKGLNYLEVGLSLLYWAHISAQPELREKARKVIDAAVRLLGAYGQIPYSLHLVMRRQDYAGRLSDSVLHAPVAHERVEFASINVAQRNNIRLVPSHFLTFPFSRRVLFGQHSTRIHTGLLC